LKKVRTKPGPAVQDHHIYTDNMSKQQKGFTEAEVLAAQWSKMQKSSNISIKTSGKGKDESSMRSKDRKRSSSPHDRQRNRHTQRSRPSSRSYRDNSDGRASPNYSPYTGNDIDVKTSPPSPKKTREYERSRSRSRSNRRYRSRSRSRSPSLTNEELARLPPPPDPIRPDHDDMIGRRSRQEAERIWSSYRTKKRQHRSRSRSRSRSGSSSSVEKEKKIRNRWTHDGFDRVRDTRSLASLNSFILIHFITLSISPPPVNLLIVHKSPKTIAHRAQPGSVVPEVLP
jgi:hypothetical protein